MPLSSQPAARLARALLSLEGLSVGDAFGEQFFVDTHQVNDLIDTRTLPEPEWYFTDDTQMALSVVSILRQYGYIKQDILAMSFGARYDARRGYGGAMHWLLPKLWQGGRWPDLAPLLFDGQGSYGNGGAMRVAPVGAYFADDLDAVVENAANSSVVTHAHPEAAAGAIAVAVGAALAARCAGGPYPTRREFLDAVLPLVPDSVVREKLRHARDLDPAASVVLGSVGARQRTRYFGAGHLPVCAVVRRGTSRLLRGSAVADRERPRRPGHDLRDGRRDCGAVGRRGEYPGRMDSGPRAAASVAPAGNQRDLTARLGGERLAAGLLCGDPAEPQRAVVGGGDPVAPVQLGGVERFIGGGNQRVAVRTARPEACRPKARCDRTALPRGRFNQAAAVLRRPESAARVGLRQNHHKLLAAVAGCKVAAARRLRQQPGDLLQHSVAGGMPEAVVVQLEVVYVQKQQRQRGSGKLRRRAFFRQALLKGSVVFQAGQTVGRRQVPQPPVGLLQLLLLVLQNHGVIANFLLGSLALGQVVPDRQQGRLAAERHRRQHNLCRKLFAVAAGVPPFEAVHSSARAAVSMSTPFSADSRPSG